MNMKNTPSKKYVCNTNSLSMGFIVGGLQEEGTAYTAQVPGFIPVFGGSMLHIFFSFLCCVVLCLFCFVCLRPVSCVSNVACFSGLSIPDCHFGFL
jgi:hypothetical protein